MRQGIAPPKASFRAVEWVGVGTVRRRLPGLLCAVFMLFCFDPADADDIDLGDQILSLERDGRAQPQAAATESRTLLPRTIALSTERLQLLTVSGLLLASSRRIDEAREVARSLGDWAGTTHAAAAAIAALLVRARVETEDGNMQDADALLDDARKRLVHGTPPRSRLRVIAAHAWVKKESGQLEPAMRLFQDGLALADELAAPEWQVDMRCGLARVYLQAGQLERARRFNNEAIAIATRSADDFSLYRVYGTEGILLDAANDRDGMRRAFERALAHARLANAGSGESLTLSNLSDVYLKNGDFKTAITMAEQALPLTRKLGDRDGETVALFNAGVAHIALHELELGKRLVAESIAIDEKRGVLASMSNSYNELGQYLERAGDAAAAVQAYHRHRALADVIVQRDQQKVLVELQERFEAERRTKDLALLNRESAIKSEQLHRQSLQQDLWWLLAGSFTLSLAALIWLHGRVRRTNRLLVASNLALAVQSERDPLTGLANRRHFHAAVTQADAELFDGTLLLIDIDDFKRVNDTHGHAAGDGVLVEVAQRLRAALREQDLLVRWGGEEFLVVVRGSNAAQVDVLAMRLLHAVADVPIAVLGRALTITVSVGYASFPVAPEGLAVSAERAIRLVDSALYLAKAHGRNRAYGVRRLHAKDARAIDAVAGELAAAVKDGRVALTLLCGPHALKAAA
ncbi:hypothetical protein BH11PSE8_BH11PSE8_00900 [soil metagenome]